MAVYGGCFKTKPSFSFFRGQFWGIGFSYIRCDLLSDTESRKRCFSFSSCQGPNTRPNDPVTAMMTPMMFPRVALASMMRNSEKSLPTSKESIEHPFLGSSESSVSEQYLLVVQCFTTTWEKKNYLYTPYPSICGVWHLQISFHQHVMRWTSRRFDQLFLDPWSETAAAPLQKANNSRMACMVVLLKLESPFQYAKELQRNHPCHLYCPPSDPSLKHRISTHQLQPSTGRLPAVQTQNDALYPPGFT